VYTLAVRIWGLTGSIGSGKSTVGRMLRDRGIPVVDADQIAREVVEPGRPALRDIAERFPGSVREDGSLDRKALAARVFADPGERRALNAIVHPRIAEEVAARMASLAAAGETVAVYEAALIVENGLQQGLDGLIVVTAPAEAQIARLRLRDNMSEEEARARMASQLPAAEKARAATVVIDNGGSEADLEAQVERLIERLREAIPDLTLRTTFIVGFPGERDADFEALCDFAREVRFDRAGVFRYSDEEGTAAFELPGRVPRKLARERQRLLVGILREIQADKQQALVGREVELLIDAGGRERARGRMRSQAPEIDGEVLLCGPARTGEMLRARIVAARGADLDAIC